MLEKRETESFLLHAIKVTPNAENLESSAEIFESVTSALVLEGRGNREGSVTL